MIEEPIVVSGENYIELADDVCDNCGVQVVANPYSVPSTADNSNMPLWTVLLVGFAAVALLTGKKKKA